MVTMSSYAFAFLRSDLHATSNSDVASQLYFVFENLVPSSANMLLNVLA